MNQLAIDFTRPRCSVPEPTTQLGTLLRALQRGERLTVAQALTEYGCYALSQRCTDLKKMGWPIRTTMIRVGRNKRVAEYTLESANGCN